MQAAKDVQLEPPPRSMELCAEAAAPANLRQPRLHLVSFAEQAQQAQRSVPTHRPCVSPVLQGNLEPFQAPTGALPVLLASRPMAPPVQRSAYKASLGSAPCASCPEMTYSASPGMSSCPAV